MLAVAAAGTLTMAAVISAAAALPPGTVAAPASAAAASLTVVSSHHDPRTTRVVDPESVTRRLAKISFDRRRHAHELALARAAAAQAVATAQPAPAASAVAVQAAPGTPTPTPTPASIPVPAPAASGSPEEIAQLMLGQYGWSGGQFSCLGPLWARESGWNVYAENPGSGAYGIPQAMPGSEMASAGADWQTDAATQIRWGLTYIEDRYGSPCAAWAHEESTGWY